jgi:hypothetical protein
MTGVFDGGVYAKVVDSQQLPDGKVQYDLRHYFTTDDGSYVNTQDKSVHTPVENGLHLAQTEYTVVEAGGRFEGMTGSFKSWGAVNYDTGLGVLRFEGRISR